MNEKHEKTLGGRARLGHVAAIAIAVCCACGAFAADKPKPRAPVRIGETKIITITMDKGCLRLSDLAPHARKGDVVYWLNATGDDVTIRFTAASPFKKHHPMTIADGDIGGGVVDKDPGQGHHQSHPYTIFPTLCGRPSPDVIVDGGGIGPPPKKR